MADSPPDSSSSRSTQSTLASSRKLARLVQLVGAGSHWPVNVTLNEWTAAYQGTIDELTVARTSGMPVSVVSELNDLVAKAARIVHAPRRLRLSQLLNYIRSELPLQLKLAKPYLMVSIALVVAGFLSGFCSISTGSKLIRLVIPAELFWPIDQVLHGHLNTELPHLLPSGMVHHHEMTAVIALATGILVGLGPALILFWYGLQVGAICIAYWHADQLVRFMPWLWRSGLPGTAVLCLAGAAGLALGWNWLAPGQMTRRTALGQAGRMATALSTVALACWILERISLAF